MAHKQEKTLQELKKNFKKEGNHLNMQSIALGQPLAVLEMPTIDLTVPIYYGTTDEVLNEGIGLLEGFSDLEGGSGKHPVLTGHNGLSASRLFTRLDEVKKGAEFAILTQKGKRVYQVSDITVLPAEDLHKDMKQYIQTEEQKDQATLITCTPRNINTHRLLVTGQFVPEKKEIGWSAKDSMKKVTKKKGNWLLFASIGIGSIVFITGSLFVQRKWKKEGGKKR